MNARLGYHLEFEHLIQYVQYPMLIANRQGVITSCNNAASKLLESQIEMTGKHVQEIFPELSEQPKSNVQVSIDGKSYALIQFPLHDKRGQIGSLIMMDDQFHELLRQAVDTYETALMDLSECILGVDEKGHVNFLSRSYANLLGLPDSDSAIGKHCTEVVKNTRMHKVIKTGKPEIGHLMDINDKTVLATRIPRFENGQIIGAIGKIMFHDVDEFKALATQVQEMETKIEFYEQEIKRIQGAKFSFKSIIGNSNKIKDVKSNAEKVAKSRSTVLIKGETGTGKELFAHAIHLASPRSAGPFIPLNCAAIPKDLLEAELFGYESGAFTGAKEGGKPGKFELAKNGTLFLDEIGDLPLDMQAKLLRALERKEIDRIGGTSSKKIDVRIIAATNKDLWEMTQQGNFREDLYYRLNVFMIEIPPLRERKEDVIPIATHLIDKLSKEIGLIGASMSEDVKHALMDYSWPGNIRELENVLERSMNVVEDSGTIEMRHLPVYFRKGRSRDAMDGVYSLKEQMESTEKRAIMKALKKSDGNKNEAAKRLGIHRASLYRKMEKYEISVH